MRTVVTYSAVLIAAEGFALRKHACLNIMKILPPKNESFQNKKYDLFHISVHNINCGYSLEPLLRF